jgi:DNA-binding NtrC family response regulator
MRNILVFEKERIVCLDIRNIFSDNGFNVVFGESVRELAGREIKPALVILDQKSYEIFQKEDLWSYLGYSSALEVPLILSFSGLDTITEDELINGMNVIGRVMKPYDTSQLVEIYRTYQSEKKTL